MSRELDEVLIETYRFDDYMYARFQVGIDLYRLKKEIVSEYRMYRDFLCEDGNTYQFSFLVDIVHTNTQRYDARYVWNAMIKDGFERY